MRTEADRVILAVGRRVAEARQMRGLTQQQFAEALGVSLPYVQRIERGTQNLTIRSLVALSSLLGVTVPSLFDAPTDAAGKTGRPRKKTYG